MTSEIKETGRGSDHTNVSHDKPTQRLIAWQTEITFAEWRSSKASRQTMNENSRIAHLAWLVLVTFILTFAASRILVLLIMTHTIPDLYLHVGGTHVHHLNYGIFLLSIIGAILLFIRPIGILQDISGILYAIGLGLTFDEFGMWLHLGGPYWQRASFDAVIIISALLGLIVVGAQLSKFRPKHAIGLVVIIGMLTTLAILTTNYVLAGNHMKEHLEKIETESPA